MADFNPSRFLERPGELKDVPIDLIHANWDFNKRIQYGNIDWLAENIKVNGLVTPLVLYPEACLQDDPKAFYYDGKLKNYPKGYYRLTVQDGHRRFKAILKAKQDLGWEAETVECRRFNEGETKEERLLNQILMNSGKALEPIEAQAIFKELNNLGWDEETIAKRVGCSSVHVKRMLELSTAEELTKYMIERGEISASLVLEVLPEVRQLAQIENKAESEIISEIMQETPRTAKGGVSPRKFKEKLSSFREQKVVASDPNYFTSMDSVKLLQRLSKSVAVHQKSFDSYLVTVDSKLWETILERYKK